jgi:hypothetical protein
MFLHGIMNRILALGVIIVKQAKKIVTKKKIAILLQIFMWCHFNVMLIVGSCVKCII